MTDLVCDTSVLQYLHAIDLLELLPKLGRQIIIPTAVASELEIGRSKGLDLPVPAKLSWAELRTPAATSAPSIVTDLGPGEIEVLALTLEVPGTTAVLDDRLARRAALTLQIPFTGTLGILLSAKNRGFVPRVTPSLDRLVGCGFRVSKQALIAI